MAKINWLNDVGIPVIVGGADIGLSWWDEKRLATTPTATRFEPWLGIVGTVGGIGMMMADLWPDKAQVVAHAAIPMATKTIYDWIKSRMTPATTAARQFAAARPVAMPPAMAGRSVGYPAPSNKPEFQIQPGY